MAVVAAGAVDACGDMAGGNPIVCVSSLKARNELLLVQDTRLHTPKADTPVGVHVVARENLRTRSRL